MGRKGLCRLSNNYNIKHIRQLGLNCPFKYKTYHWPAKICSNHCTLGDSIVKFLKITNQADVISFPGINVDRLTWKIKLNKISLTYYKIIIIHVGTNDVECRSVDEFINRNYRVLMSVCASVCVCFCVCVCVCVSVYKKTQKIMVQST